MRSDPGVLRRLALRVGEQKVLHAAELSSAGAEAVEYNMGDAALHCRRLEAMREAAASNVRALACVCAHMLNVCAACVY